MRISWNRRYVWHCLNCQEWSSESSKLLILTVLLSVLIFAFPSPSSFVFSGQSPAVAVAVEEATVKIPVAAPPVKPAVKTLTAFLEKYNVDETHRSRIVEAIVNSSLKYNVDPRLVGSIMIVESRANPFAISGSDSIGIMQIHLPTWGHTADREGINLFKIEDNVDFGVRILKDYIRRFGTWEGVKRYKGWNAESPESTQAAADYVEKVQRLYAYEKSPTPQLLQ